MNAERRTGVFQAYAVALCLVLQLLILGAALRLTDGTFVYTLDDPYIHLALAESLLEGEYGINSGEFASPSSSILYPFLLAAGLRLGVGEWAPLMLSAPFSLAATWILAGFVWRALDGASDRLSIPVALPLGAAIVLATNAAALPMTGMEHSIHVFATLLAVTGLHRLSLDPGDRASLIAVLAGTLLCSTIRFEGLALAVAMLAALFALGFRIQALATGAVVALALGLYAATMARLGLPVLPSSVMVKSDIAAQAGDGDALGMITGLGANMLEAIQNRWGVLLALVTIVLLGTAYGRGMDTGRRRIFLLAVAFILFAHVAAGRYGWFGRYEVYVVAAMLIGIFSLPIARVRTSIWAPGALLIICAPYAVTTVKTPAAAENIYQQQYQMRRFSQEFFPEPVAVNDLGLVAFGNENYVLDLWGLGSEEARRLRANGEWPSDLLHQITRRHAVTYAMIYTGWFGELPAEWCHIADLQTTQVTSAFDTVSFFLVQPHREEDMRAALQALSAEIPAGARLDSHPCPPS